MKVHIGISLTDGDNMTWEEGQRPYSRMQTHGWTDSVEEHQALGSHANKSRWSAGGYGWDAQTSVLDHEEVGDLPETLFVVIYSSGVWYSESQGRTLYGGSHGSWGVQAAFVDREKAETFVKTETKKWLWLWVSEVKRFVPTSAS